MLSGNAIAERAVDVPVGLSTGSVNGQEPVFSIFDPPGMVPSTGVAGCRDRAGDLPSGKHFGLRRGSPINEIGAALPAHQIARAYRMAIRALEPRGRSGWVNNGELLDGGDRDIREEPAARSAIAKILAGDFIDAALASARRADAE